MTRADLIQLTGLTIVVLAAFLLWSIPVGVLAAGIAMVVVGIAEELR